MRSRALVPDTTLAVFEGHDPPSKAAEVVAAAGGTRRTADGLLDAIAYGGAVRSEQTVSRCNVYATVPRPDGVNLGPNLRPVDGQENLEAVEVGPDPQTTPVTGLTGSTAEGDVVGSHRRHANAALAEPVGPDSSVDLVRPFDDRLPTPVRRPPTSE